MFGVVKGMTDHDVDTLVGCEEEGCPWWGDEGEYPDHYLLAHLGCGDGEVDEDPAAVVDQAVHPANAPHGLPGAVPDPRDPVFGEPGLPDWVAEFRPHQWTAVLEILAAYDDGADVVFLDAPTGSGKTLIAEAVRRVLGARALYVCSGKSLQDQFLADYPYAAVLKGRSNYPTVTAPYPMVTTGDCTKKPGDDESCNWCPRVSECAYERAKMAAYRSPIAVINTAYLLAEANHVGKIAKGRGLVVLDECDVMERELMGFVEFSLTDRMLRDLGIAAPKKGVHKPTLAKWFMEVLGPAVKDKLALVPRYSNDVKVLRQRQMLERLDRRVPGMAVDVMDDNWVRDNKAGPLVLKPVTVGGYGVENLWRHGEKWLCMSATIVSAGEMADSLGLNGGVGGEGLDWRVVTVPMTFPVENRTMHVAGVANMVAKEKDDAYPKMAKAVSNVLNTHPGERVLVHTVSYDLARYLHREVAKLQRRTNMGPHRHLVTYSNSRDREPAIAEYRAHDAAVMFAPSLDRGVDFKHEDCRVVVVAKVPFPYLGDMQVSQRMHMPGGQQWYTVQTIRTLVQMTGRGVRSESDWCVTYILDGQFGRNVWKKNKRLLPEWWREALDMRYDGRWLRT